MPLSAKEFTDITALIKLIINGYPGNAAIFREYLQNSDDAKATLQRFVFDERAFPNITLVDPVLKGSQGAALIAINDGLLADADWMALRKINSSSKQTDDSQTGKNGLGFRASYHLTENPHIFSGRTLMILDPHHEFESPHDGGISIDIVDEGMDYRDQLLPFTSYRPAGEEDNGFYKGTIFRLPLRTVDQAKRSKIKSTPTSVDDMRQVLHDFVEKEFEEVILFLKHIITIEVLHINPSGQETCLARVTIDAPIPSPVPSTLIRRTTVVSADGTPSTRDWKFHFVHHSKADAKRLMDSRLEYDIGDSLTKEKLSPTIDVAFPLRGSPIRGRLFTLLPFPHSTNFPIHLNAVFALDPTRQNLKNIQEVGVSTSRERMLVEWNKLIFDTWTPQIWAELLSDLPANIIRPLGWSLWPPEEHGEDCYWKGLSASLTKSVIDSRLAVFPTVSFNNHTSSLVRIDDPNVLLAPSNPAISLDILCDLGVHVVQPPAHLFNAILALSATTSSTQISQLSPQSLHHILSQKPSSAFDACEDSQLRDVLDYLGFSEAPPAGNLTYIHGLPWFRCTCDDRRVPLGLRNSGTKYVIPQTETEASIFSSHPNLLAWNSMSKTLHDKLSTTFASTILNVGVIEASDVFSFLKSRLSHVSPTEDEIMAVEGDHQWVVEFWSWVIDWTKVCDFFRANLREVSSLFLLPTSRGSLRKLSSRVAHFTHGESFVEAWKMLGVYPISPDLPHSVVTKLRDMSFIPNLRTWPHIAFLIKNCNLHPSNVSDEALKNTFRDIRMSLFDSLPRSAASSLSSTEKTKFKQFPIFMVRGGHAMRSELNTIDGHCQYVDVDDNFPLPRLQAHSSAIFVDMRDSTTQSLLRLIESNMTIEKELQLLQLAVDNWEWQKEDYRDIFIDRMFLNSRQLPAKLRQSLAEIPFVTVNDHVQRVTPRDLIHPRSIISVLYQGEPANMPTGRFSQDDYLAVMQSFGFIRSSLDAHVVQDRLQYITTTTQLKDPWLHDKAASFLHLLDRYWSRDYTEHVVQNRNTAWLPVPGSPVLLAPAECRDNYRDPHAHPYYYDLVLRVWQTTLSPAFRTALGWSSAVSINVLSSQLISTFELDNRSSNRSDRLVKLIVYLNQLHSEGHLNEFVLQDLRASLNGRAWVPSSSLSGDVVEARYALLEDSPLKLPFCPIDSRLTRVPFLHLMGCGNRPSLSLLLDQLHKIVGLLPRQGPTPPFISSLGREAAIAILHEIVTHHQNDIAHSGIHIPCENAQAYPLNDVYFRDMKHASLSPAMQGKFAAHSVISSSLAELLGMQLLSSIALGDDNDDDDDEEQMSEDLVTRIRGFLRDYDPQFALTEFLANADDARAQHFSLLLLDTSRRYNQGRVISPPFQSLLESPSLVLHNNSKLSGKDFIGIRRIGQGGKRDQIETHGRHGLGALSFYYFTDVVTIISDGTVMILDPSGSYLPPRVRQGKRTTLTRKLSEFVSLFPDQLKPYEDLFGFSAKNPVYNGTLFCLPLRAKISEKACDLVKTRRYIESSYRQLAHQALLFTGLEKITAIERSDGQNNLFWSFSASRSLDKPVGDIDIRDIQIRLDSKSQNTEQWIIATSETGEVPEQHLSTAYAMKLAPRNVKVQLAINVAQVESREFVGFPFSTVPLPKSTSLPFHVNARFAISSNRQSLVLNSADSQNQKDAHTSFNTWILESLALPLYLEALQYLLQRAIRSPPELKSKLWWRFDASDDLSRIVTDALSKALPLVNARIFKACDGQWITFAQSVFSRGQPSQITDLLSQLKVPYFVKSQRHGDISRLDNAKHVDPQFVQQAVVMNAARILSLSNLVLKAEHFFTTLEYIRNEPVLVGLPLLMLTSSQVTTIPGISEDPIFYSEDDRHSTFFLSSKFVVKGYSAETIQRLVTDASVNVTTLTENNVVNLIAQELRALTSVHRSKWIQTFWRIHYGTLPGPPSLEALESSGMRLVETSNSAIPLTQCFPHLVVYDSYGTAALHSWLPTFLETLQIDFVKPFENAALRKYFSQRFPDIVDNVLQCINTKGFHTLDKLSADLIDKFSEWAQRDLPSRLSTWKQKHATLPIDKAKLARLPIWSAYQNGNTRRRSATEVAILPSHFDIAHILPFLKPNTVLATWSTLLSAFMEFCLGDRGSILSPSGIMSVVTLPTTLTWNKQVADMREFITSMLQFPNVQFSSIGLTIPDQQGHMRSVQEIYDDTNSLFAATLRFTPRSSFLHPAFGTLIPLLRNQGLVHTITLATFQHCANAVSAAYQTYGPSSDNWQQVRLMSTMAFLTYQTAMPPLILTDQSPWMTLDAIRFVQRKSVRRQGVSYHVQEHYCAGGLPEILAPSRFVLSKFEPIVWTQRALFLSEPSDRIVTINTKLGVPEAQEVVAHLKILTTVIANDHPGDLTLLSDIRATYKWLNENADSARLYLQAIKDEKIFLNVDDPTIKSWRGNWASAKEIVLNLQYDVRSIKYVREFLQAFEPLLLATGCETLKRSNKGLDAFQPSASPGDTSILRWKEGFNKLRVSGQFTDVVLVPTSVTSSSQSLVDSSSVGSSHNSSIIDEDAISVTAPHLGPGRDAIEDVVVDNSQLRAHRVVLAVAIPHLLTLQTWKSVNNAFISFFGSPFGAKAVLDFVYTGEFELSTPTQDVEVLSRLMRDLLEVLPVADEWDMKDLKEKIQWEIIYKHDMIQRLPHEFDTLLKQAKTYNAQMLADELEKFEKLHGNILEALKAELKVEQGNEAD